MLFFRVRRRDVFVAIDAKGLSLPAEFGELFSVLLVEHSGYPAESFAGSQHNETQTDDQGKYRFVVTEGQHKLTLEDDSRYVAAYQLLDCRKGKTLTPPPVLAERGGWIVGRVTDALTGQPVTHRGDEHGKVPVLLSVFGPARQQGN